ncbi:lymphocyte antigen 6 complex locus protein G6d-like [Lissotriton helveticus]
MARWQLVAALVAALCVCLGEGLQCYKCDAFCTNLIRKNVTCAAGEVCGKSQTYKGNSPSITAESCLNKTLCGTTSNKTQDLGLGNLNYNVKYTCCDGDLCNSGNMFTFTLLSGISALVVMFLNI